MPRPKYHLFVCLQDRGPGHPRGSCNREGEGEALLGAFAVALSQHRLLNKVAINATDCLGPCVFGPNVLVYPDGVLYSGLGEADVTQIVEQHLIQGEVVEDKIASPLDWS